MTLRQQIIICYFGFASILTLVSEAGAHSRLLGDEATHLRGMARLLGSQGQAEEFLATVWGGDKPYLFPASSQNRSLNLLWSKDLSKEYLEETRGRPWMYEDDIKIVKSGQVHYKSNKPGSWKDVKRSLGEGATVVMHDLQQRHPPIHDLGAELEDELEIFVSANSYLTPAGSMGFDPHFDWHDIMVLQLEGTKTWTICEQRDVDIYDQFNRGNKQLGIFKHGEDFGDCMDLTFRPGDLFYAPLGTIHYAEADASTDGSISDQYSMHLTLSLIRQQFTWGLFFQDIAETQTQHYSSRISKLVSHNKQLQSQVPIELLREIGYSVDNEDLPKGFLRSLRQQAQAIATDELSSIPELKSFILPLLLDESKNNFEETVSLYRYKMVMGRLKQSERCPSNEEMREVSELSFRRFHYQRLMLEELEFGIVVVTGAEDDEQHLFPLEWKSGLRYVFSGQSRDNFVTVQDIATNTDMNKSKVRTMLNALMEACLLDGRRMDESCEA